MDPTADDVRAGNAVYDATNGIYVWLPGKQPPIDDGNSGAIVTITAPPKDTSVWIVLLLGLAAWALS